MQLIVLKASVMNVSMKLEEINFLHIALSSLGSFLQYLEEQRSQRGMIMTEKMKMDKILSS